MFYFVGGITMKKKKLIRVLLVSLLAVCIAAGGLFCLYCVLLTDSRINGFVGVAGILRLGEDETYVVLQEEPLRILMRRGEEETFENEYFDSMEEDGTDYWKYGYIDGVRYELKLGAFTGKYTLASIEKCPASVQ